MSERMPSNYVRLKGRIGQDAKLHNGQYGQFVTFSIATSNNYERDGEWIERPPTWHSVSYADEDAAALCGGLTAGKMVVVEGRIVYNEDKKGNKYANIKARQIELGTRREEPQQAPAQVQGEPEVEEDDLPF